MSNERATHPLRTVAVVAGVVVVGFVAISLAVARRTAQAQQQRCSEVMAPLVAQAASPEAVERRIGSSGETYRRAAKAELQARVRQWGPPPATRDRIASAADRYASARLYSGSDIVIVAFHDEADRVREYACFGNTSD
jgi:hypothetical protein